ncbi:NAD dependent epimerase/dehydratase [Cystobasidium minutum MCA 4210]|uniref:NAD dependent epimerase/dehydratase n=1 Tax=Cystobasidium minutum MCA 4210 TaxID=1397322 RepID=UPI0034CE62B5|eukprot:jgi/Rhomi1/69765/CE69764_5460
MDLGLRGTSVCVTGANGGIGLATCKQFLSQGARVLAHYNRSSANLETLKKEAGEALTLVQANLTQESDVDKIFANQSCQVLVVNHATYEDKDAPMKDMTLEQWNNTLTTNLTSTFLVIRAFLRQLESQSDEDKLKAAIVLIGSTAGKYGEAGHADYAASKSAMMGGLLLSLKNEIVKIAPRGRVNSINPGWTATPMAKQALQDEKVVYAALASTPLRKVATPQDIANQILVVASPVLSGHVTGQNIMVEGGMEGRLLNKKEDIDFASVKSMVL